MCALAMDSSPARGSHLISRLKSGGNFMQFIAGICKVLRWREKKIQMSRDYYFADIMNTRKLTNKRESFRWKKGKYFVLLFNVSHVEKCCRACDKISFSFCVPKERQEKAAK